MAQNTSPGSCLAPQVQTGAGGCGGGGGGDCLGGCGDAGRAVALLDQRPDQQRPGVDTCALFAEDRGYADVYRSRVPGTPVIAAAQQQLTALKDSIMARAKRAGVLRADVEPADIAILTWGIAAIIDATRDTAPHAWRRHLALALDGLRPEAARPLPAPPLTVSQLQNATPR
jgi:hypothetical protein